MKRWMLLLAGHTCVGLGILGVFLPLMPATVFFLLAAAAYVRSSPRHYERLMAHRLVGPLLRGYREKRALPLPLKIAGLVGLWASLAVTLVLVDLPPVRWGVLVIGAVMTLAVLRTRTLKDGDA